MKAISLISGGLDSELAAELVRRQSIEVVGLHFTTPFYLPIKKEKTNYELKEVFLTEEYLEIVKSPKYGYGKNLNPCIDCKILMLKKAKELMPKLGALFVVTGEVLGQRPMSQNLPTLKLIEKESGLEGYIVRPLSAKLLPESIPEKKGWVDRNKFLAISGRSRKEQLKLAKDYNIQNFSQPAGGCLLTDPAFSCRLKDLLEHSKDKKLSLEDVELLKIGRHFRISANFKVIVGRNQQENEKLRSFVKPPYIYVEPKDTVGPSGLGVGSFTKEELELFLNIVATYCDGTSEFVTISLYPENTICTAKRINKIILEKYRL